MTRAIEVPVKIVPDEAIKGSEKTQQALQGVQKELTKTSDVGRTTATKVVDDLDTVGKKSTSVGENVKGQLGGSFVDFDGTASGALRSVGSSLGSLAAVIPGFGGLIGSVIGTIAGKAFTDMADNADKAKQRVQDALDDMIKSGQNFVSQQFLDKAIEDILSDDKQLEAAKKWADSLKLPVQTVVSALAGVPSAVEEVNERIGSSTDKLQSRLDGASKQQTADRVAQLRSLNELSGKIADTTNGYDKAADKANIYAQAAAGVARDSSTASSNVGGLGRALDELPTSKSVNVTTSADPASVDAALDELQRRANARPPILIKGSIVGRYGEGIL